MKLIILGAGGYGQTVADLAQQCGQYASVVFLDDSAVGDQVVGTCGEFIHFKGADVQMYPAFGDQQARLCWLNRLAQADINSPVIIHPTAYVSPTATVEAGAVILPRAVVNTSCTVKRGCIVNCGAIVDHGCVLEEGVHVCLGAIVKAENRIPQGMKIEAGQVVENRAYPL